ncbi:hypothetical protein BB347_17775 (plasmid) [Natronorubrum daqingense]|nr:hypothetical protein BB347_17775 [Natronorubrum daqingense]
MTSDKKDDQNDSEREREPLEADDCARPDEWERVSFEDLPTPDTGEHPIPEPNELTEERTQDSSP